MHHALNPFQTLNPFCSSQTTDLRFPSQEASKRLQRGLSRCARVDGIFRAFLEMAEVRDPSNQDPAASGHPYGLKLW